MALGHFSPHDSIFTNDINRSLLLNSSVDFISSNITSRLIISFKLADEIKKSVFLGSL